MMNFVAVQIVIVAAATLGWALGFDLTWRLFVVICFTGFCSGIIEWLWPFDSEKGV